MDRLPNILLRLQHYLTDIVPLNGILQPHPARESLPLEFQESHAPFVGTIGSRCVTFLITTVAQPAAAARAATYVGNCLHAQDVVIVAENLTAAQRRGLMAANTAFIVPHAHLWLPMLSMLSHERAAPVPDHGALKPATQALLVQWYHHGVNSAATLANAAKVLGYTTMTMSRAFDEILRHQPSGLRMERIGRERRCTSGLTGNALWQHFFPRARTPVMKSLLARKTPALQELPRAGLSALATVSDLTPPTIEVRAMDINQWRDRRAGITIIAPYEQPDELVTHIEIWSYPVRLHNPVSSIAEPLSVALSIPPQDREDPRVAIALRTLEASP